MTHRRPLPACVVVMPAVVASIAAACSSHPSAARNGSPARSCTTARLEIRSRHTGAALGTVGGYVSFTNRSSVACRLRGWPELVALTRGGSASRARHVRSTMFGPRPTIRGVPVVKLEPGQRADAVFTGTDIPPPGKATCTPAYRYLRVTAPGGSRSVRLSAWNQGLAQYLPSCSRPEVSFVVPAAWVYRG